jgi:hypothetical protein
MNNGVLRSKKSHSHPLELHFSSYANVMTKTATPQLFARIQHPYQYRTTFEPSFLQENPVKQRNLVGHWNNPISSHLDKLQRTQPQHPRSAIEDSEYNNAKRHIISSSNSHRPKACGGGL